MPKSLVEQCSQTIQKMLGYSIHSALMGYFVVGIGRATGGGTYRAYWTNVFSTSTDPSCN